MFYSQASRQIQDRFGSRRTADRLLETRRRGEFDDTDKELIENAPIFFLATADAGGRPDCSMKGGEPGFVRVVGNNVLVFPHYDGNGMFRSLGNIVENPYVGILFVELTAQRRKLRINGSAFLDDAPGSVAAFPGAKLLVHVSAVDIFPNCPRYVPNVNSVGTSIYNPRHDYRPPEPTWKSNPDLAPFLPGAPDSTSLE